MKTKDNKGAWARIVVMVLLVLGWMIPPSGVVYAAGPWYVRMDGSDANCDGLTDAADPGSGAIPRACAFSSITYAIGAASAGDTVFIDAGTFDETPVITKALTLDGAGAGSTYLQPTSGTNILTISASNVTIKEMSLDGGAGVGGSGIVDGSSTALSGIVIDDCEITYAPIHGISFSNVSFQANRNYIANNTLAGVNSTAGGTVTLFRNTIQVNGSNGVSFSAGTLTATENVVTDNVRGFNLGASGVAAVVQKNDLSNNSSRALVKGTGSVVDASLNWWGSSVAATVRTQANGGTNTDYTPWLNSSTDTSSATPGFQPGYSVLWVDDDSPQTGSNGRIQEGADAVATGGTVRVEAGTYSEDVVVSKGSTLSGAGIDQSTIVGLKTAGANSATLRINTSAVVTIDGFTITRDGNNTTDWAANPKMAGLAIQGSAGNAIVRNNKFTGNRTAIDLNFTSGNQIHNNLIDFNRTGIVLRNQCPNNLIEENQITNNWTDGILWLAASTEDASGTRFFNNNVSDNWYAQIENRSLTGGVKNFSGNWLGATTLTTANTNGSEPGYGLLIPVEYGGAATPPGGALSVRGVGIGDMDYTPWLNSGTDISTPEIGFQGSFATLWIGSQDAQSGTSGRLAEAVGLVDAGGEVIALSAVYSETSAIAKSVKLTGYAGAAVFTQIDLNAGADINSASSGLTAGTVNVNANTVTISDGVLLGTDNPLTVVNVNAAGTYAESVVINRSLILSGNTSGSMAGNTRVIDPPAGNAILVDGGGLQVLVRGFRLTGATNGLRVANGATVKAHGNVIDNVDTAFRVSFGSTLTAYANNITDFVTGIVPDGTVNARHNWWDAINPPNVGQADAFNYRLGADVMGYNSATGGTDASVADTLASGNATLSGGGASATRVIINHGHSLPNVPFGKGQTMYTDTEPPCADFYDMFVIGGTGSYTIGIPVKAGLCQTNAATNAALWRMSLINTDQPNTACNALDRTDCWVQVNGTYAGGVISITGLTNNELAGTPFVPSNEGTHSPTAIELMELTARSGLGTPVALLVVSLTVLGLLAGVFVWKRNK